MAIRMNLKPFLDEREISMREFGRIIDHHHDQVRKFCNEELKRIPVDLLDKICKELDVPLSEILYYEEDDEENEV